MLGASGILDSIGGGGDIWSTGAFSFESPLKDLLDGDGEYTLEQLLAEDELLQELRGCHHKLIRYFSTEQAVTKLVEYVILPLQEAEKKTTSAAAATASVSSVVMNGGVKAAEGTTEKQKEPGEWLQPHFDEDYGASKPKNPQDHDPALKHIRFPYMACEVICCEIPGIIDTLVEGTVAHTPSTSAQTAAGGNKEEANNNDANNNSNVPVIVSSESRENVELVAAETQQPLLILDLLFSLLTRTPPGQLDDYRAGYFDKILTVLFRKRPQMMTSYMNSGGAAGRETLQYSMLRHHLSSHSIMQIAQRLLLPQRPVDQQQQLQQNNEQGGGDEIVAGDDDEELLEGAGGSGQVLCDWSDSPAVLEMLLDTLMLVPSGGSTTTAIDAESEVTEMQLDLSLNASEVLITIIQNSMLCSPIMLSLTSGPTISRLVDAATYLPDGAPFSRHESLLTSAMNVLESLILQLGGYGAVGTMSLLPPSPEEDEAAQANDDANAAATAGLGDNPVSKDETIGDETETLDGDEEGDKHLISDLTSLLVHLPRMLENLSKLLKHPSTATWTTPTQFSRGEPQQMLGNSRLRIVRVLESLVLLGDPDIDAKLVRSDCLEICLDFFWQFQWCSMLHQSVANLLVHVFEGQNTRCEMQAYFLIKCNLLGRLMDSFVENNTTAAAAAAATVGEAEGLTPSGSATRLSDVVENLDDVAMISSVESEKGSSSSADAQLPVSEDDVEAAMEAQKYAMDDDAVVAAASDSASAVADAAEAAVAAVRDNNDYDIEQASTEAVWFESRDVSMIGDATAGVASPSQVWRFGYMGHVIIICQALVHAYSNEPQDMDMTEATEGSATGSNLPAGGGVAAASAMEDRYVDARSCKIVHDEGGGAAFGGGDEKGDDVAERDELAAPKDDFGEPLLLYEIVHTHALAERWQEFVDTTLAAETAVQSTPLGGFIMQPGMNQMYAHHRPGLADEGYMMGDDGEGPPAPPRGMLGGGDVIDMDDNDLEIAASMMAGLALDRSPAGGGDGDDDSANSGNSESSYNSGEPASSKTGYAFDDPLGKAGGLGIELGKLTQYEASAAVNPSGASGVEDGDDGSHSSDEGPESHHRSSSDSDVPVLDLFTGNFPDADRAAAVSDAVPLEDFANFADFGSSDDAFGPFSGAAAGDATTPSNRSSNNDQDWKSAEIEEIFGKGDHAALLLEQDDEPILEIPFEHNPFGQVAATPISEKAEETRRESGSSNDQDSKSAEIEEIFGKGDHAALLLKQDDEPLLEMAVEHNAFEQVAATRISETPEETWRESGVVPAGQSEIKFAPSDELDADIVREEHWEVQPPENASLDDDI